MLTMRQQFDYLLFRPHNFVANGDAVRVRVEHVYRHKRSGELISGNFRAVFVVRDGLIARCDEYHDRALVEAFMRLFGGA
jgi:ketosteroid isomerase-like protein